MKRLFILIFVFTLTFSFVSCSESKEVNINSSEPDNSDAQIFLKADPANSEEYKAAINAYNKFLNGDLKAKDKVTSNTEKSIEINDMIKAGNGLPVLMLMRCLM
jgi:hypothetical protein